MPHYPTVAEILVVTDRVTQVARLSDRVEQLTRALTIYGQHRPLCRSRRVVHHGVAAACTCGLDRARTEREPQ